MCTYSISGSSLLSSYDENDAHETSGKSRREFELIDSVLYDEEAPKRLSIEKICEEWANKPHFRIRGHSYCLDYQNDIKQIQRRSNRLSPIDHVPKQFNITNFNFNNGNFSFDDRTSGRSSIDSIEGSVISDNGDIDNDNELDNSDTASTILGDRSTANEAYSFDTDDDDEDDDDNDDEIDNYTLAQTRHNRAKYPQRLIKCLKDSIINSLASSLIQKFLSDEQPLLQLYVKHVCENNSIRLRSEPRPSSLPPRSSSRGRMSQTAIQSTNISLQQNPPMTTIPSAFRSTTDSSIVLESILHVKRIGGMKASQYQTATASPSSPRKPQNSVPPTPVRTERAATSLSLEKRNQQQISLVGTAISNMPPQVMFSMPQSSQAHTRQTTTIVTRRYGSATTSSSIAHTTDSGARLPPIPNDHLTHNDVGMPNRSHVVTTTIIESTPLATRIVSGKSSGSNLSSTTKMRTFSNPGKFSRTSRSIILTPNKDLNNSPSISPIRSITANISSTILKATSATRSHQQPQKKSFVTTKSSSPSSSSTAAIKLPATHIY